MRNTWLMGSAMACSSRNSGDMQFSLKADMSICGGFPIRTHIDVPGYGGSSRLYLSAINGGRNLPPRKWCGPSNFLAHSFGAVKETWRKQISLYKMHIIFWKFYYEEIKKSKNSKRLHIYKHNDFAKLSLKAQIHVQKGNFIFYMMFLTNLSNPQLEQNTLPADHGQWEHQNSQDLLSGQCDPKHGIHFIPRHLMFDPKSSQFSQIFHYL